MVIYGSQEDDASCSHWMKTGDTADLKCISKIAAKPSSGRNYIAMSAQDFYKCDDSKILLLCGLGNRQENGATAEEFWWTWEGSNPRPYALTSRDVLAWMHGR